MGAKEKFANRSFIEQQPNPRDQTSVAEGIDGVVTHKLKEDSYNNQNFITRNWIAKHSTNIHSWI